MILGRSSEDQTVSPPGSAGKPCPGLPGQEAWYARRDSGLRHPVEALPMVVDGQVAFECLLGAACCIPCFIERLAQIEISGERAHQGLVQSPSLGSEDRDDVEPLPLRRVLG